jgi:tetratricopeptide (TPR) repeat protein
MRTDTSRHLVTAGLVWGLLLLAGCATGVPADSGARAPRGSGVAQPPAAASRTEPAPAPSDAVSPPPETSANDAIARILADRKRADYPEIEVLESGFTIKEQVQIRSDARTAYERALGLLEQERYDEGITVLRDVVETTPDATAPYIDLAIAYGRIGDLEHAEESLTTAALLSPDNPVIYNELGIVYRRTGRFAEARASYEQALAVFGDFHYARRNLAVLCDLYLADLDCALQNYRQYLRSVGGDPEVEIWVADIENRLGR